MSDALLDSGLCSDAVLSLSASQNALSPSNKVTPLPAQQSLQLPIARDRNDSQSSQGSGSAYGSTTGPRGPRGSSDLSAPLQSSPQDRKLYRPDSRQSPSRTLGALQHDYSFRPQPQAVRQEESVRSRSGTPKRTEEHEAPQLAQASSKTNTPRHEAQGSSSGMPQSASQRSLNQGLVTPVSGFSPPANTNQNPLTQSSATQYTEPPQGDNALGLQPSGKPASAKEDRLRVGVPSPAPEMLVEPPTPDPSRCGAAMESMQSTDFFSAAPHPPTRDPTEHVNAADVASGSSIPPVTTEKHTPSSATKQRARLAPIVTSSGDTSGSPQKSRAGADRLGHLRRASFHPNAQHSVGYSRDVLLRSSIAPAGTAAALLEDPAAADKELEDETLANVEEMLDGFDWGAVELARADEQRNTSTTEVFESRLFDELNALEAVSRMFLLLCHVTAKGI